MEEVLLIGVNCGMMSLGQPKSESGWSPSPKGGEAVSVYEIIVIVFLAMTFVVALIKLMIYITDTFSGKGK